MTIADARAAAARLGLQAVVDAAGWCLLLPRGRALVGRGGTWEEAFANAARVLADEAARPAVPEEPVQRELF